MRSVILVTATLAALLFAGCAGNTVQPVDQLVAAARPGIPSTMPDAREERLSWNLEDGQLLNTQVAFADALHQVTVTINTDGTLDTGPVTDRLDTSPAPRDTTSRLPVDAISQEIRTAFDTYEAGPMTGTIAFASTTMGWIWTAHLSATNPTELGERIITITASYDAAGNPIAAQTLFDELQDIRETLHMPALGTATTTFLLPPGQSAMTLYLESPGEIIEADMIKATLRAPTGATYEFSDFHQFNLDNAPAGQWTVTIEGNLLLDDDVTLSVFTVTHNQA